MVTMNLMRFEDNAYFAQEARKARSMAAKAVHDNEGRKMQMYLRVLNEKTKGYVS